MFLSLPPPGVPSAEDEEKAVPQEDHEPLPQGRQPQSELLAHGVMVLRGLLTPEEQVELIREALQDADLIQVRELSWAWLLLFFCFSFSPLCFC